MRPTYPPPWLLALLIPLAFLLPVAAAALLTPGFAFGQSFLSDLGLGPAAWLFALACVLAGALLVALGCSLPRQPALSRIRSALLALSGLSLALVGLIPLSSEPGHTIATIAFFLPAIAAICLTALARLRASRSWFSWASALIALTELALLATQLPPLPQLLAVSLFGLWLLLLAADLRA